MFRKLALALTGFGAIGIAVVFALTIPMLRRLPEQGRVSMDGITTIDDAVEACRRTHLQGWDLVAYAQHLVARKFTYSRLNTWDTPSRAFERGMGYGEQQALALKKIYDRLVFAVAIVLNWRGSLRGRLLLGGMLFYFVYQYLQYATMVAFNPLFLVYVVIFALSAVAFFLNLRGIEVARLPEHVSARFPRRLFIGFTFVMSAALTVLWVGSRIIPYTLTGHFPDDIAGMTTLVTQAFDLGMLVPLLLSTGILLWRRSAWGYLLAGVSLTVGFIMSITLPAWIAVPLIQSGQINLVQAIPFVLLCLVGLSIAGRFFWSVQEQRAHSRGCSKG